MLCYQSCWHVLHIENLWLVLYGLFDSHLWYDSLVWMKNTNSVKRLKWLKEVFKNMLIWAEVSTQVVCLKIQNASSQTLTFQKDVLFSSMKAFLKWWKMIFISS